MKFLVNVKEVGIVVHEDNSVGYRVALDTGGWMWFDTLELFEESGYDVSEWNPVGGYSVSRTIRPMARVTYTYDGAIPCPEQVAQNPYSGNLNKDV